mgnify:CR=1 FL=1|tara:strand:+ start:194 stop:838 length:645 start_codon:yes stop_codon:yes gene_type:complete
MKKLILLLFIPLVSFGQLTLETMSHINDSQSFKRAMIENGFSVREDGTGVENEIEYEKLGIGDIPEILAYYLPKGEDADEFADDKMMFVYTSDYKGENETYKAIFDKVKNECQFSDVGEGVGGDIAYYMCEYEKPPKELLELQAYFEKELPDMPNINILQYMVGFNKNKSLHLIHFPTPKKTDNSAMTIMKRIIDMKKSGELDALEKIDLDSID